MSISEPRAAILAEARAWLGTPARHRMTVRGLGIDDFGLVWALGGACGLLASDAPAGEPYPEHPAPEELALRLGRLLMPIRADEALAADIVQLGDRCAILSEFDGRATLIRVQEPHGARVLKTSAPAHAVVEHGFRDPWPARACAWFRFPGLS